MQYRQYVRVVNSSKMALLMIHGILGTPNHFRDLLPLIPKNWSVYNILLDGHGKQIEDFCHTSMAKWKVQVQTQLESIFAQHEKLIIVGHSMGALFAIDAAVRYPDKIVQLFFHGTPLVVHTPPSTSFAVCRVIFDQVKPGTAAARMQQDCGVHLTKKIWKYLPTIPRFVELLREARRVRKLLPQLTTPCRTYQGAQDEIVSLRSCVYLEKHPTIVCTVLPRSGHFSFEAEDKALVQADFLQILEQYQ